MADIPEDLKKQIVARLLEDLQHSGAAAYAKVGVAIVLGGVISMAICGQFGIGSTNMAVALNHDIFLFAGSIFTAIFCGAIYAIIPVFLLRLITSPLQFRAIIFRDYLALLTWLLGFGLLLTLHSEQQIDHIGFLAWLLAGYAVFKGLATLFIKIENEFWGHVT